MKAKDSAFMKISTAGIEVSKDFTFNKGLQLTKSADLQIMKSFVDNFSKKHTPEETELFKRDVYDAYNQACSQVLLYFAPEIEMRPDLTTEAIKRAQEEILQEAMERDPMEAFRLVTGEDVQECTEPSPIAQDATVQ